ncbi:Protein of unknown function DUF2815 [uncultured Caudovirales phage]|uniref:Uncharacterized protein n=1 Tax=uncultured Caudovirales phage TaxID=2100421 RepID=A0A6J5RXD5_9CAUD|nr:Protein of unknown function DUF2815 [uncultured Caudovirales phage]
MVQITLRDVVMRFGDIWTPRPPKDGKGEAKFGATFLLDPKKHKAEIKLINDTIRKVAKDKWKDKSTRILSTLEGDAQKFCYFEEDMIDTDGDDVEGTEGMFYLRTKSPVQPTVIDRDRTELEKRDGRIYNGVRVVAKVDIWPQDNVHGKGMRCQLQGIQFFKDGEAFGGGTRAKADDFEDLSDLGDDDDAPAPKRRARAEEDDDDAPAKKPAKKKRPPVDDDDDDIG